MTLKYPAIIRRDENRIKKFQRLTGNYQKNGREILPGYYSAEDNPRA